MSSCKVKWCIAAAGESGYCSIHERSPNFRPEESPKVDPARLTDCPTCKGDGTCQKCNGAGECLHCWAECAPCDGTGDCPTCNGTGKIEKEIEGEP